MEVRVALGELLTDQKFNVAPADRLRPKIKAARAQPFPDGMPPSAPELLIENSGGIHTFPASLIVNAQMAFDAVMAEKEPDATPES